jgi:hypothetical protein
VGAHRFRGRWCGLGQLGAGEPVTLGVRAERVQLSNGNAPAEDGQNLLDCRTGTTIYKGKYLDQTVATDVGAMKARIWDSGLEISRITRLWWREDDCVIMPRE